LSEGISAGGATDVPGDDAKAREGIDFLLGEAAGASPKDPAKVSPALANNGVEVFLGGVGAEDGDGVLAEGFGGVFFGFVVGAADDEGCVEGRGDFCGAFYG